MGSNHHRGMLFHCQGSATRGCCQSLIHWKGENLQDQSPVQELILDQSLIQGMTLVQSLNQILGVEVVGMEAVIHQIQ